MAIVTIFYQQKSRSVAMPLITVLGLIKNGKHANDVYRLRGLYHRDLDTLFDIEKRQLPRFSVSGNFKYDDDKLELISYSSFLFFEIKYLRPNKMANVRTLLEINPYVYACFKNTLGLGLCFIVKTEVVIGLHKSIYQKAHRYFETQLKIRRMQKPGKNIKHLCLMTHDPEIKINVASIPFPYYGTPKY